MNNIIVPSAVAKIITFIFLVFVGYAGVQLWQARLEAQEAPRPIYQLPANMADINAALRTEQSKPRFIGDIDGVFLAPSEVPVPEAYVTYEDVCGNQYGHSVPWEQAGELDLKLELPKKYVLQVDDPNTDVVACGDMVFVARRTYSVGGGQVIIGRSLFTHDTPNVSVDRPKSSFVNGRDVVLVEPVTPDGTFQNSYAWFPEPFGDTFISGAGLSQKDFVELVTLVASSTR